MATLHTGTTDAEGVFLLADEADPELAQFEDELASVSMVGEWQIPRKPEPDPGGVPHLWPWNLAYEKMIKASDALSLDMGGRRSLLFVNPAELPNRGSVLGVRVGLQMMNASEMAYPHRHTMAAIRFVIQGSPHTYTVVNGERIYMEDWSLILTPPQAWHHHENHGRDKVIWLDAIDTPFVKSVNALFYEPYAEAEGAPGLSADARKARGEDRWAPEPTSHVAAATVYRWAETERTLKTLAATPGSPHDGILLKYVNPVTGGPVMQTFSCSIQMLRPGERTRAHRHTHGAVYHVLRGSGTTRAGDAAMEWEAGDSFVVPNWCWHEHRNRRDGEDALLFVVDDSPVLDAAGLSREEGA